MTTILDRSRTSFSQAQISEIDLEAIAKVIDKHTLAACRAVSLNIYILSQIAADAPAKDSVLCFRGLIG